MAFGTIENVVKPKPMAMRVALKLKPKKRRRKCGLWFATRRERKGWII